MVGYLRIVFLRQVSMIRERKAVFFINGHIGYLKFYIQYMEIFSAIGQWGFINILLEIFENIFKM